MVSLSDEVTDANPRCCTPLNAVALRMPTHKPPIPVMSGMNKADHDSISVPSPITGATVIHHERQANEDAGDRGAQEECIVSEPIEAGAVQ